MHSVHSKKHSFVIQFWFLHDAIQVCLLSRIGTVVAADVYQIVQNMFVSVQYEPQNLGNAYAVSEPYYGYDSGTSDCRSVSDLANCNSKDTYRRSVPREQRI